jgi:hypothetical protein
MEQLRRVDGQFLADLDEILAWAAERGITRRTRFHVYRDNIRWLREHDADEDRTAVYAQLERDGRLTEILSTMSESIELVETISALRQNEAEIPPEILCRAFSGPLDAFHEDCTSNQARNAMFELSMAAMAARQGLKPRLSIANPDVSFVFGARRVKLECKRVLSESKIMDRLSEGIKQLAKTIDADAREIGLVAISLSRILNPGDRFLVSESPYDALSTLVTDVLRANEQVLGRMLRPSVAGFLFYVSSVACVPGKGYSPIRSGTVFPLNVAETPFLRNLASTLRV